MSIWVKLQPAMMQDQRGFISLLTCIMLSLLMIVVTLSLVTIESLQFRKSGLRAVLARLLCLGGWGRRCGIPGAERVDD
jgi:hypothetical protein